mmetsp:Transcript_44417/g.95365  ORF Transcript_44417/g.95365 Transcript_44417/m.95365 type:complete len:161 (+) Transcript_44417:345-827(+)
MDDLGGMLLTISTSSREIHYGSTTMPVLMIPMAITTTKTRANGLTYPQAKREALGSLDSKGIQSVSFMQASHLILRKSCFVCIICVFTRTYRAVCQTQNNEAGVSSMEENVKEKKSEEKPEFKELELALLRAKAWRMALAVIEDFDNSGPESRASDCRLR